MIQLALQLQTESFLLFGLCLSMSKREQCTNTRHEKGDITTGPTDIHRIKSIMNYSMPINLTTSMRWTNSLKDQERNSNTYLCISFCRVSVSPLVKTNTTNKQKPTVTKNSLLWSQSQEVYGWLFSESQNLSTGCDDPEILACLCQNGRKQDLFIMENFNHKSRREYYNEPPDPVT